MGVHKYLILLLAILLFSCKGDPIVIPITTVIEGQILTAEYPVISLVTDVIKKTTVDQEGKFYLNVEMGQAGIYSLLYGSQKLHIFIRPGDRIQLTTDSRNLYKSTIFKGDHSNENNYLVHFEKLKSNTLPIDQKSFFGQNENDFILAVEKRLEEFITDKQDYQKKNLAFDEHFAELLAKEHTYDIANIKMAYPEYYNFYHPDSLLKISDTYESFFQNIEIDNSENLSVPSYKSFIYTYLLFKTKIDSTDQDTPEAIRKFDLISQTFKSKDVKSYLYYELLFKTINESINDARLIIDAYRKEQSNNLLLDEIDTIYHNWDDLMPDKKAPSIEWISSNGTKNSLLNLNDKPMYIAVWGNIDEVDQNELTYWNTLANNDKEINFLSITTDSKFINWRRDIKKYGIKGDLGYIENADFLSILKQYNIETLPRFILIDKSGYIINANAPKASNISLDKVLN